MKFLVKPIASKIDSACGNKKVGCGGQCTSKRVDNCPAQCTIKLG